MSWITSTLAGALCLLAGGVLPAAEYSLAFLDCPAAISGRPGEVRSFEVSATLSGSGAEGWTMAFASEGGRIVGLWTEGLSVAAALRGDGGSSTGEFEFSLSDAARATNLAFDFGGNSSRALSSVLLDAENEVVLDSRTGAQTIARFLVETTIREEPFTLTLRYADGLFESESGRPVSNTVMVAGAAETALLGECAIDVRPALPAGPEFKLALVPAGQTGSPSGDTLLEMYASPGEIVVPVEVLLSTTGLMGDAGPLGWSLSIENEPSMEVEQVTVNGLSLIVLAADDGGELVEKTVPLKDCPAPGVVPLPGPSPPGAVEICSDTATGEDPSPLPDDARGVVSAAVLHLSRMRALRPNATDAVLRIFYKLRVPEAGTVSSRAFFSAGLKPPIGQPVHNVITHQGASREPTLAQGLTIRVSPIPSGEFFIRGDPNGDGRLDIADAVWLFEDLFLLPVMRTRCRDAGDANDDGGLDISDPVYLLKYLFTGGARPPDPHPTCGWVEGTTDDSCPPGSTGCATTR